MTEATLRLTHVRKQAKPMRFKFTAKALNALRPGTQRRWVYDGKGGGLALMVTAAGTKTLYRCKRVGGKSERYRIGTFPQVSIFRARQVCDQLSGEEAGGGNPSERRRQRRGEQTLQELWDAYTTTHAAIHCTSKTREAEASLWRVTIGPSLGGRKLSGIKSTDVAKMHADAATRGKISANRAVQVTRRLFNFAAKRHGYEGGNPAANVDLFREPSRTRFLSADEMPRFLASLKHEDQAHQDYFRLSLWTAARKSNLQSMRWADLDLTRQVWIISGDESKNAMSMTLPLVPAALDILNRRKAENDQRDQPSAYVFPAVRRRQPQQHIGQMQVVWKRIIERAGITNLTPHDLRRSAGSWQAIGGSSLPVIGASLGHTDQRATQIYARLSDASVRQSMQAAVAAMLSTEESQA